MPDASSWCLHASWWSLLMLQQTLNAPASVPITHLKEQTHRHLCMPRDTSGVMFRTCSTPLLVSVSALGFLLCLLVVPSIGASCLPSGGLLVPPTIAFCLVVPPGASETALLTALVSKLHLWIARKSVVCDYRFAEHWCNAPARTRNAPERTNPSTPIHAMRNVI